MFIIRLDWINLYLLHNDRICRWHRCLEGFVIIDMTVSRVLTTCGSRLQGHSIPYFQVLHFRSSWVSLISSNNGDNIPSYFWRLSQQIHAQEPVCPIIMESGWRLSVYHWFFKDEVCDSTVNHIMNLKYSSPSGSYGNQKVAKTYIRTTDTWKNSIKILKIFR